MAKQAFLCKYAEIGIKGKNRYKFENALCEQIRRRLAKIDGEFTVVREQGRIFVEADGDYDFEDAIDAMSHVFGVSGISPVDVIEEKDWDKLTVCVGDFVEHQYGSKPFTFKVKCRRSDKHYPLTSPEVCVEMGSYLLDRFENVKVDVHDPDVYIWVEIRDKAYVYSKVYTGACGMPLGTNGRAMLLLSGGIDSPAKIISKYVGPIRLHVVNFTDIQLYIYEKCPHEELTIIMRRYMMRIAEKLAYDNDCLGLITGESIGQVASQTMQSLAATNAVCNMPVYRPLIGFDKNDIIAISEKIDTYETSIQPFEDCCTIFVAKHPVTKPNLKIIERSEQHLNEKIDELMQTAIETTETITVCEE